MVYARAHTHKHTLLATSGNRRKDKIVFSHTSLGTIVNIISADFIEIGLRQKKKSKLKADLQSIPSRFHFWH